MRSPKARALAPVITDALVRHGWARYAGGNPELEDAWVSNNVVGFFYHSRDMKRMYHVEVWIGSNGKHTGFIHEDQLEQFISSNIKPLQLRKVRG